MHLFLLWSCYWMGITISCVIYNLCHFLSYPLTAKNICHPCHISGFFFSDWTNKYVIEILSFPRAFFYLFCCRNRLTLFGTYSVYILDICVSQGGGKGSQKWRLSWTGFSNHNNIKKRYFWRQRNWQCREFLSIIDNNL